MTWGQRKLISVRCAEKRFVKKYRKERSFGFSFFEEYARQHGLRNIRHFYDDGYSGTNFNRPGFAALLEEVEAGRVETLVVKNLSRFGRNYLQVGYYTEILFPKKGVRFIAINNNVDSATPHDNDFTE